MNDCVTARVEFFVNVVILTAFDRANSNKRGHKEEVESLLHRA